MPKSKTLFGISFNEESLESISEQVQLAWSQNQALRIATVNPEFLVAAHRNEKLKNTLERADIRTVDGFGLFLALWFKNWNGKRVTGVDIVQELLPLAEALEKEVVVVIQDTGLSSKELVENTLQKKYPNLHLSVAYVSQFQSIEKAKGLFLLGLGLPEQEYVAESLQAGVAIGVGGAIDFLTGAQKRAPQFMRQIGLEWLWRLMCQPRRFTRILNATIIFPILVFADYFKTRLLQ